MKYYIIAGEASGDLHGSNLIKALKKKDAQAQIRCWGGDLMQAAGGELTKHYKEMAFMGFFEVIANIPAILGNIKYCKKDIEALWVIYNRKVHLDPEDPNYSYLKEAFSILQNFEADNDTWRLWTEKIQTLSGRKGKDLFQPLRYALTGSYSGPDMNKLLPIMILNGLEIIE